MLLKTIHTLGLVAVMAAGAELVSGFTADAGPSPPPTVPLTAPWAW